MVVARTLLPGETFLDLEFTDELAVVFGFFEVDHGCKLLLGWDLHDFGLHGAETCTEEL